jgi:putative transposase
MATGARDWDTRVGTIELELPGSARATTCPASLEPRRRAERALVTMVAQCYLAGVSTRRGEDIAQAMGIESRQVELVRARAVP